MTIPFTCPHCRAVLKVGEHLAGKSAAGPRCAKSIRFPSTVLSPPLPTPAVVSPPVNKPPVAVQAPAVWIVAIGNQQFWPVDEGTLRQWLTENRVSPADYVRRPQDGQWTPIAAALHLVPVATPLPTDNDEAFTIDLVPRRLNVNIVGLIRDGAKTGTLHKRGKVLDGETIIRRGDRDLAIELYTIGSAQALLFAISFVVVLLGLVIGGMILLYPDQNNWLAFDNLPAQFALRGAVLLACSIAIGAMISIGRAIGRKHQLVLTAADVTSFRHFKDSQDPEQTQIVVQLRSGEQLGFSLATSRSSDARRLFEWLQEGAP